MTNITNGREGRMEDISNTLRIIKDFIGIYEKQIDKCKVRINDNKMTDEEFGLQMNYHYQRFDSSIKFLINDIKDLFTK